MHNLAALVNDDNYKFDQESYEVLNQVGIFLNNNYASKKIFFSELYLDHMVGCVFEKLN